MKQKPSFSAITGQPAKPRLSALPQKNAPTGKPSLADLMNQYDEGEYSTISLKMNSDAPKLQLQMEERQPGLIGFGAVGDEWYRKQQQSPLRLHNKENINDQGIYRKKPIHEVNRFGDCVRELDKNRHTPDHSQDEDLSAFQPRTVASRSPLRGKQTTPTSSLLKHAEQDLVFRAKVPESKPINFTELSKRFNGDSTPRQLQKQPQTRSRSKLAPKIQKQFQESDDSEHDSEAVSLRESISEHKTKLFQFHSNLRPQQKEELERKVHQIKQENLKILAEKKSMSGNKMLPKVIEDMKINVAREIEEFARNYLLDSRKEPQTIVETRVTNFHQYLEDPKRKKIIEETKTHIRDYIEVKDKKASSFEEDDIRHITHPTQQPKLISNVRPNQKESEKARLEAINQQIVRQTMLEQEREREQRRLSEETIQFQQEEQRKRFIEEENQRIIEEQATRKREWEYAESQRLRIQEEERLRMIQIEQARMMAEAERIRQHQLEEERLRNEQRRLNELKHEQAEKQKLRELEEQKLRKIQEENAEAELMRVRALEEETLRIQFLQIRRLEEERAQQAEKQRLRREEEKEQLIQIELMRRAQQERLEAEREHQRRIDEEKRLEIEMEEQRIRRLAEQEREENERIRIKLLEEEQLRKKESLEQQRIHRQIEERAHHEARDLEERLKQQKEIEEARDRERLLDLERQQTERRERLRSQQENADRVERERLDKIKREREEAQVQERQRVARLQREEYQRNRLEEQKREQAQIRLIEEEKLRKAQIEETERRSKQESLKSTPQSRPVLPETTTIVAPQNEEMRASLKVESLFSNYSIFSRQPEPEVTPQDRINKLFDKTRNDKTPDVQFKFDFGLDLGLDEEEPKKKVSFDESTLNSKDRLPSYGARRR